MQFAIDTGGSKSKGMAIIALTPLGKQRVEALDGQGEEFTLLSTLAEKGPATVKEIAQESGIEEKRARYILKYHSLPRGLIQKVNTKEQ